MGLCTSWVKLKKQTPEQFSKRAIKVMAKENSQKWQTVEKHEEHEKAVSIVFKPMPLLSSNVQSYAIAVQQC